VLDLASVEVANSVGSNGWYLIRTVDRLLCSHVSRYDCLRGAVENDGVTPRWSPQDGFILVYKYVSANFLMCHEES
jgi:hypothetical protein